MTNAAATQNTVTTVAAHCHGCSAETAVKVPAAVWKAWKKGQLTSERAFHTLTATERRWITNGMCPDCYARAVCADEVTAYFEAQCPGCDRWESFGVPRAALQAFRAGDITDTQAFPHHNPDERTMIECGWHIDCWDAAAMPTNEGINGRAIR